MSEIWFKTGGWREKIEAVQVVKVTTKTVTVQTKRFSIGSKEDTFDERRHDKVSGYDCFFPTWEEAHAHLLKKAETTLESARLHLQRSQSELGNIKGLKKPEQQPAVA